jgi:hypothetical protein
MRRAKHPATFATEAELVAAFCAAVERINHVYRDKPDSHMRWTIYAETAGFDLLLVQDATGVQVGIEAKLTLNLKVLDQALPSRWGDWGEEPTRAPDYRAVLVPMGGVQHNLARIAELLGLTVLSVYNQRYDPSEEPGFEPWPGWVKPEPDWSFTPSLPDETEQGTGLWGDHWHSWLPEQRCELPGYIPDVLGGVASPVKLTPWKVKAIKLVVLLDRKGYVTRGDMRFLKIGPTMWTGFDGWLDPDRGRQAYVRSDRTPDFRRQHPRVYAEIEADFPNWGPPPLLIS